VTLIDFLSSYPHSDIFNVLRPWDVQAIIPTRANVRTNARSRICTKAPLPGIQRGDVLRVWDAELVIPRCVLGPVLLLAAVAAEARQREPRSGGSSLGELQARACWRWEQAWELCS